MQTMPRLQFKTGVYDANFCNTPLCQVKTGLYLRKASIEGFTVCNMHHVVILSLCSTYTLTLCSFVLRLHAFIHSYKPDETQKIYLLLPYPHVQYSTCIPSSLISIATTVYFMELYGTCTCMRHIHVWHSSTCTCNRCYSCTNASSVASVCPYELMVESLKLAQAECAIFSNKTASKYGQNRYYTKKPCFNCFVVCLAYTWTMLAS